MGTRFCRLARDRLEGRDGPCFGPHHGRSDRADDFFVHTEDDLVLASTTGGSMQRQELSLHGAQGKGTKLAELPIPAKYRYVPENAPANSPYNVAQLYARFANSIRNGTPASPGFDAAVKRHRLIDAIVRASTTGQKQLSIGG